MKKEEIHLWDWNRILIGQAPLEFMAEVFIRTIIVYLILLVVMRLLGKRMNINVSVLDMAIMVTLGAIISPGMQLPGRGLVPVLLVLVCVVAFQRILSLLAFKFRKVEVLIQGDVTLVVQDGVIDVDQLRRSVISHGELFEQLRGNKLRHLGEVKRVYLEGSGQFSIFKNAEAKPGLCILPAEDQNLFNSEPRSNRFLACKYCGQVVEATSAKPAPCPHCQKNDWDKAVQVAAEKTIPHFQPDQTQISSPAQRS